MRVIRAKTAGFCMGVGLALRKLDSALNAVTGSQTRLATLGPVIHNPRLIRDYEEKGVACLGEPEDARPGDTVLIRAHGVPREVEAALAARDVTILDATCPKVKRAQLAIATEWGDGSESGHKTLLLYGEADHPEVMGLVSYAQGNASVFRTLDELESITLDPHREYFIAAQTTQDIKGFDAACNRVRERLGHDVPILHTICDATRKRQDEVIRLAVEVDAMVVVGGSNSGNTRRLAEVAESEGVRAFLIEDVTELAPAMFAGMRTVGLTAGASTPAAHIDAVEAFLRDIASPA